MESKVGMLGGEVRSIDMGTEYLLYRYCYSNIQTFGETKCSKMISMRATVEMM